LIIQVFSTGVLTIDRSWRKAASHRNGVQVNAVDGIRTTVIVSVRRAAERPSVR